MTWISFSRHFHYNSIVGCRKVYFFVFLFWRAQFCVFFFFVFFILYFSKPSLHTLSSYECRSRQTNEIIVQMKKRSEHSPSNSHQLNRREVSFNMMSCHRVARKRCRSARRIEWIWEKRDNAIAPLLRCKTCQMNFTNQHHHRRRSEERENFKFMDGLDSVCWI